VVLVEAELAELITGAFLEEPLVVTMVLEVVVES
jgi:hypothetical protein